MMKVILQLGCEVPESLVPILDALSFDQVDGIEETISSTYTHILRLDKNGLSLLENDSALSQSAPSPTQVDFLNGAIEHRRLTSGKSQGIAKAVGLNKLEAPTIVDATAGLGKDSFILASLGAKMTLLERSPLVYALLKDGFRRGLESPDSELRMILSAMELHNIDAQSYFDKIKAGLENKPDVIYLDPMFPPRSKSAKVKKDIAMLQQVLGFDEEFGSLLAQARDCAEHRVVVKRPGKDKKNSLGADFQIVGKSAHFNVYLPK